MNYVKIGDVRNGLKEGKCYARSIWEGTDKKFVFKLVPAEIKAEIVPKIQSLPDGAKELFAKTFADENEQIDALYYSDQLVVVGLSNLIDTYAFSAQDFFGEDWYEVKP